MGRSGEGDEQHRFPHAEAADEEDRQRAEGEDEHRDLTDLDDVVAALGEALDEPAGEDAEDGDDTVEDDERQGRGLEVEVLLALEVVRQPDQVEPPDRVGEELGHHVGPGLTLAEQAEPGHLAIRSDLLVVELRGFLEERDPEEDPYDAEQAGDDEGGAPAVVEGHQRDDRGSDEGADVRAGIEERVGEGPLGAREPLRDGLDGRGEITPFTDP